MSTLGHAIACGPQPDCADPHRCRWYCMRGLSLDDEEPGTPGVCLVPVCVKREANR